MHAVLKIRKGVAEGEIRRALLFTLAISRRIKKVLAVDEDVDTFDLQELEWAMATRFQADRDIIVIPDIEAIPKIDPTVEMERPISAKMAINAARLSTASDRFERSMPPKEALEKARSLLKGMGR